MALALLELTENSAGDVLEQLLSTTIAEAGRRQQAVPDGAINRVCLYTEIGSNLPGVAPVIRSKLECAAMSCLDHIARRPGSALQDGDITFTALWRDGVLQELQTRSLRDGVAAWLQQASPAEAYVLLELRSLAPESVPDTGGLEQLYGRLRDNVTWHIQYCRGHRNSLGLTR